MKNWQNATKYDIFHPFIGCLDYILYWIHMTQASGTVLEQVVMTQILRSWGQGIKSQHKLVSRLFLWGTYICSIFLTFYHCFRQRKVILSSCCGMIKIEVNSLNTHDKLLYPYWWQSVRAVSLTFLSIFQTSPNSLSCQSSSWLLWLFSLGQDKLDLAPVDSSW